MRQRYGVVWGLWTLPRGKVSTNSLDEAEEAKARTRMLDSNALFAKYSYIPGRYQIVMNGYTIPDIDACCRAGLAWLKIEVVFLPSPPLVSNDSYGDLSRYSYVVKLVSSKLSLLLLLYLY